MNNYTQRYYLPTLICCWFATTVVTIRKARFVPIFARIEGDSNFLSESDERTDGRTVTVVTIDIL